MKPGIEAAAVCGLFCGTCPSYGNECNGCLSDKLAKSCALCPAGFRRCAREHEISRCYECDEFPCGRLEKFSTQHIVSGICHHENVIPDLQNMKEDGLESWIKRQLDECRCPRCGEIIIWHEKFTHNCSK